MHRQDLKEICTEHYYKDEEICQEDSNGRRLFLSNEFHPESGRHRTLDLVTDKNKIKKNTLKIIDNGVFDSENKNIALSKNDFANCILERKDSFVDFDFQPFHEVFEIIDKILTHHCGLVT